MIVLLAVLATLLGAVSYLGGREVRTALEARRATPALPRLGWDDLIAPARDRSLDASSRPCSHVTRPAAVVPYAHDAPVAWVCPDCDATVPEPPPLGPPVPSGHPARDDGRFITTGTIRADKITASTITVGGGVNRIRLAADGVSPATGGPTDVYGARPVAGVDVARGVDGAPGVSSLAEERHSVRSAIDAAQERADAIARAFEDDDNGHFDITKDQQRAYSAACATVKELSAYLAAMPEPETYEVRSHASDFPVRTYTAPAPLTGYEPTRDRMDATEATKRSQGEMLRALGIPGPSMGPSGDFRRTNYAVLLHHAGHDSAYIAAAMAEWDRRQTTAEPVRVQLGRGWPADDISSLM